MLFLILVVFAIFIFLYWARKNNKLFWKQPQDPANAVISGSSQGQEVTTTSANAGAKAV